MLEDLGFLRKSQLFFFSTHILCGYRSLIHGVESGPLADGKDVSHAGLVGLELADAAAQTVGGDA